MWVAYGVVARRGEGEEQRGLLGQVARRLVEYLYGDIASPARASPNALLCDFAATRIVTMAHGAGAITVEEAGAVRHPPLLPRGRAGSCEGDLDALFPAGAERVTVGIDSLVPVITGRLRGLRGPPGHPPLQHVAARIRLSPAGPRGSAAMILSWWTPPASRPSRKASRSPSGPL
ncbi:hypothetical protein LV779_25740 [Streptomyces thinghirensis]|nr:hypothetical protein [Streptomyces thinghirensis]